MTEILDSQEYLTRLLKAPRPEAAKFRAFYDHRVGAICTDSKLMFAPLDDHILHRGDGIFEVMKIVGRRLYQLDAHLKRMRRSAKAIQLTPPCTWERLRELSLDVAKAADFENGMLRILMGRGPGGFHVDPTECPFPSLYIVAYAVHLKPEELFEKGVTAFRSSIPAKQKYMAQIKSVDYLPNVLVKLEALEKGYDYGLTFDGDGFLAEGSTENSCLVDQKGVLHVPEFTHALMGTTLMRGLDLIKDEVPILFKNITEAEIYHAKELMVVGTTIDALSIVRYNDKPIHDVRPGPVSRRMRQLLMQDLSENGIPV